MKKMKPVWVLTQNIGFIFFQFKNKFLTIFFRFYNGGCNGGMIKSTFEYILKHGIPTEREYGSYLEEV